MNRTSQTRLFLCDLVSASGRSEEDVLAEALAKMHAVAFCPVEGRSTWAKRFRMGWLSMTEDKKSVGLATRGR